MCGRMCGLPHFSHDPKSPIRISQCCHIYVAFILYLYSVFICQMTVMLFSPDKTRAFLPALLGDKYMDLMVVPCFVETRRALWLVKLRLVLTVEAEGT